MSHSIDLLQMVQIKQGAQYSTVKAQQSLSKVGVSGKLMSRTLHFASGQVTVDPKQETAWTATKNPEFPSQDP